ncbi:C2 domain-containing protein [Hordeum vulgare]|nr:C2 domain-containing protein [Hordeum vulgare]
MDDDLEAAAGLASLASSGAAPIGRGKPRAPCKTAALPKKKKVRPREKTNSKKEDKQDAASIAFLEKVEGMISKKDLAEEKHRQEKEEHMNVFMKIQSRRLEMHAEKQAKMLELEEAKQAKMLEIEVVTANTKAKEVVLASMKMGVEIMKVDLNTVSSRKRLWFEKMQAAMFKFDHL